MVLALTNYNDLLSLKESQTSEERKKYDKHLAFANEIKKEISELKTEKDAALLFETNSEEEKLSWRNKNACEDKKNDSQ